MTQVYTPTWGIGFAARKSVGILKTLRKEPQ
nr:MAG TPA: hypothetical protein [Caudoviricetes sp.]DAY02921.1 MAG TPA: hypothetical protein [Caudoviricetes sp.]